jgi:hypothetical protein
MMRFSQIVGLLTLSLTAVMVRGQSSRGKIAGLASDSTSAVISQVAVTVTNEGTGAKRRVLTDSSGITW